jgi:phosphopantothenoylcysteine decarboxylase / phosphopantothenate---cysteine ligase
VILTRSAQEFVGAITFESLTGRAAHTELFVDGAALEHIRLARAAHLVVVAPATADFMARAANGQAGDLLSACLLATDAPVLLVPAMNDRMWAHPATKRNAQALREIGYRVLEPDVGDLAIGEGVGPGRMPEPEVIVSHVGRLLETPGSLEGRTVVVSAGPTREALDPVRYISNRSSGRMGAAIAASAWRRGAKVTLVAGPLAIPAPVGVELVKVESTEQMRDAIASRLADSDALVMAAAPADFRPHTVADQKIKKSASPKSVDLAPTPDILRDTRASRRNGMVVVGFALETDDALANARGKLESKDLDLVVLNNARDDGAGFEVETNRVTLIDREGTSETLPLMSKSNVAEAILDRVEAMLRGR